MEPTDLDIVDNPKWRAAFLVDGELRWAPQRGNGIGEKVFDETTNHGQTWKMREYGDVIYLALKEPHEGTEEEIQAANEKRVEAYLDKVAADMVAQSPMVPPPPYESIRPMLSENQDAILTMVSRDGVVATDVHGYVDNEFDNPGPRLHRETQIISKGYYALMNRDKDSVFDRLGEQLLQTLQLPSKEEDGTEKNAEEQGYESDGSAVSQDRCRVSPAYPSCKDDCWLKQAVSFPKPTTQQSRHEPVDVSNAVSADLYSKIEPDSTRILVIAPGNIDDQVKCTLEPMEILGALERGEDDPAERRLYEALSYTWGDSTKCQNIECNGKLVGVSQNLYEALLSIRLPDKSRTIWIDALCINQDDDTEKSEQVQHMYAIYRAAIRVIAWLGVEGDDSDFAILGVKFIRHRKNRAAIMRHDHRHDCLVQLARLIGSIESLTKRPWFSRSWIRQEVAAAPKVTIRCGSAEVSWTSLKRSVNTLARLWRKYEVSKALFDGDDDEFKGLPGSSGGESYALSFLKKDWVVGQSLLASSGDLGSIWYYHTGSLLELLMAGRAYDATNARDKVYAVLGMADLSSHPRDQIPRLLWQGDAKREPPAMVIDYSATVSEVYQHAAKYLVNRDENLDILCILPNHRDATSSDIPSWTPDWRVSLSSRPLYDNWDSFSYKWGASGFTKSDIQDFSEVNRLNVTGFEAARVEELIPLFPPHLPHLPERPTSSAIRYDETKHHRRFAYTSRGSAIIPSTTVVGDAIWILYGCKMPVVLRRVAASRTDDVYEVIGPCYVATIMFGEALEWLEGGQEGKHDLKLTSIALV